MNKGKHRLKAVQGMDELRPALSRERMTWFFLICLMLLS